MAASDFVMKIDGVEGESEQKGYEKQIEISSFSWGITQSGTFAAGGGGGAGKASFQDLHCTSGVGKHSVKLAELCATGAHIPKAVLTVRKAGGTQEVAYTVTMEDLLISSYQSGGSAGSDLLPVDQFSLNFAKYSFEYKSQDAKGKTGSPMKTGFDLKKGIKT